MASKVRTEAACLTAAFAEITTLDYRIKALCKAHTRHVEEIDEALAKLERELAA